MFISGVMIVETAVQPDGSPLKSGSVLCNGNQHAGQGGAK